ncbi:MAG: glycoside hydrolase, partial [Armatimonadota bacterium]|nr:glycoside hydrolase [Armatimonadota bacterium]
MMAHSDPMRYADTARGRPLSKDPSVVFFQGQYFLYYSLGPWTNGLTPPPNVNNGWTIGIATSDDLTHWTKAGELLPAGDYEKQGLCAPGARVWNGKVHLFYQTYGNGPRDAICHATSEDGIAFTRDASNPIFSPHGSWTSGRAIDAEAFPFGDRLL